MESAPTADTDVLGWHFGAIFDGIIGQLEERPRQSGGRLRPVGNMPHLDALEAFEPVVGRAVDRNDQHFPLDQRDERQEQLAVDPVLVEVAGRPVRRRHDLHPALEQFAEQARQDHRIGRIGDLHLIEREQPRFIGDLFRDGFDRIAFLAVRGCARSRASVSSMNAWKCTLRFGCASMCAKARSISIDLPRPTPPHR